MSSSKSLLLAALFGVVNAAHAQLVATPSALPSTAQLVFEGDSITVGLLCNAPLNYPTRAILQLPSGPTYTNTTIATTGISSLTLDQNYATRGGASYSGSYAMNVLMFMAGTNTSGASDTNYGQKYWLNRDYLRKARNTGYNRIFLGTDLARNDDSGTAWYTVLQPLNTVQRAYFNSDMQADGLMDWGASQFFVPNTAASDFVIFNSGDSLHPIPAGCQQMANIAASVISPGLQVPGTQVFAPRTWSPFTNGVNGYGGLDGTVNLSANLRTATVPSGAATYGIRGFPGARTGQYYWECTATLQTAVTCGIASDSFLFNNTTFIGEDAAGNSLGYRSNGNIELGNSVKATASTYTTGDVIDVAANFTTTNIWFRKCTSGTCASWNGNGSANPATGIGGISFSTMTVGAGDRYYPAGGIFTGSDALVSDFGASQLTQAIPAGFSTFGP